MGALLVGLATLGPIESGAGGKEPSGAAAKSLDREVARLREEVALSRSKEFYLRIDLRKKNLALVLQGVVLDDYPVRSLQLGLRRVAFWRLPAPSDWDLKPFRGGRLEPPRERDRIEIRAPLPSPGGTPAASPTPPPIPRTAEETYSVPGRYRIVFGEDFSLEVTAQNGGRNRTLGQRLSDAVSLWARDFRNAVRRSKGESARLRVELAGDAAASLYRSLPPDVALTVAGLAGR